MKYDDYLFKIINKYTRWAKFDWCLLIHDKHTNKMYTYDIEDHTRRSISYIIECMLENGMLNECFTQDELEILLSSVPKRFKKEIEYYVTTM